MTKFSLNDLQRIISERSGSTSENSYTKSLLESGTNRIAKKFGEEAIELVIAATDSQSEEIITESADVLYHLLVLLKSKDVDLADVMRELEARTRQSGHQEKAGRRKAQSD